MARFNPPTYPAPDQDQTVAGTPMYASQVRAPAEAINYLYARGRCQPQVSQGWWASYCARTNAKAGTPNGIWRIPYLSPIHNQVRIRAYVAQDVAGAGAQIEFRSVNAGAAVNVAIPAGGYNGWITTAPGAGLVVDASVLEYEDVEVYMGGDGTWPIVLKTVSIDYEESTVALPAGAVTDIYGTFVPMDSLECADYQPIASDMLCTMRSNLVYLERRPRVLVAWSAMDHLDGAPYIMENLQDLYHRVWGRPNPGMSNALTVWIRTENPIAATICHIQHGDGNARVDNPWDTQTTIPLGPPPVWTKTAVTWQDAIAIAGAPHSLMNLDWAGDRDPATLNMIRSVSIWGK